MKKKLVSVLLTAALMCSVLAGCGNSNSNSGSSTAAADTGSDTATADDAAPAEAEGESASADTGSGDGKYDLTLYTINSTDEDFNDWLANVEGATGLKINVIAAPTDSDTRQQKITTILSTGDSSVDILEINDEMKFRMA